MGALRNIEMLARYTQWANERLYGALATLEEPVLQAPHPGGRPGGMAGVLGHMLVVDRIWKGHLQGQDHGFTSRTLEHSPACAQLAAMQAEEDGWYQRYAQAQTEETLAGKIDFRFVDGGAGCMRRGDILLHVINHKTYHRGYVADMLYGLGLKPPTLDLPVFLRDAEQPAP